MEITLSHRKIIWFFSTIALVLISIHTIILIMYFIINDPKVFGFVHMFDLDMERNIPTFFSSILLLFSGFLFYVLSFLSKVSKDPMPTHRYWFGLSLVFTFLAIDENAKIHEQIGDFTKQFIDVGGYLYYPWVISYVMLTLILAIVYFKFFLSMPKKLFLAFMLAAFIFLSGAIGFELIGANESSIHGTSTIRYSILYTIEESLEMFGVIYLIHILLGILETYPTLHLNIK